MGEPRIGPIEKPDPEKVVDVDVLDLDDARAIHIEYEDGNQDQLVVGDVDVPGDVLNIDEEDPVLGLARVLLQHARGGCTRDKRRRGGGRNG